MGLRCLVDSPSVPDRTVAFTSIPNTKLVMSMGVDSAGAPTSRLRAVPRNWKPSA